MRKGWDLLAARPRSLFAAGAVERHLLGGLAVAVLWGAIAWAVSS